MSGVPSSVVEVLTFLFPLVAVLALVATIGIAWVIFEDAQARGISEATATVWGVGVAFLFPIMAPFYLIFVVRSRIRETAVTTRERLTTWLSFSFGFSFVFTAIATPPDPFTQLLTLLIVFPVVVVGAYILLMKAGYRISFSQLA